VEPQLLGLLASPVRAVRGYNLVYSYTIGFTIEEQAVHVAGISQLSPPKP
jgi:hypothetical protein